MTIYTALFVQKSELADAAGFPPSLKKTIFNPHITVKFHPEHLHRELIGEKVEIVVTGYGNNGENEGFLVSEIRTDNPHMKKLVEAIRIPHITYSVSSRGLPKNTRNLQFRELEHPFTVTGIYNCYDSSN